MIDCALVEEASRYGSDLNSWGLRVLGPFHSSPFSFGQTSKGECYDHFGARMENLQEGNMLSLAVAKGSTVSGKGCWDLIEVNCAANEAHNLEWNSARAEPQEVRGEKEINWEESSLAKFSYFLGFPTEGLEKEILGFFYQDQKKAGKDTQQR